MEFQTIDLFHWDYLIVDCGYVYRLIRQKEDIISKTAINDEQGNEDHALMFFIDYDYNSPRSIPSAVMTRSAELRFASLTEKSSYEMTPVQSDDDNVWGAVMGLIDQKRLSSVQAVCFKQGDWDLDLVEMLQEYRHCGCFGGHPYQIASFKTENGKTVLYKKFDTESG